MIKQCVTILLLIVLFSTPIQAKPKCEKISLPVLKYLMAKEGYFLYLSGKSRNEPHILQTFLRYNGDFILVESDKNECVLSATRGIYLTGVGRRGA